MQGDLLNLVVLPLGLGLLGSIEPCSIGSSILSLQYLEGRDASGRMAQAAALTLTRAVVIGLLGALAAWIGAASLSFQKAGWVLLGVLSVVLGAIYVAGKAGWFARGIGPGIGRALNDRTGPIGLGVLFGLNLPACAAPLLLAVIGAAAGSAQIGRGFMALAIFGSALSLPIVFAVMWRPAQRYIERAASFSGRAPFWMGLILIAVGEWSIHLGLSP
jgi:cytochrome c-type biogenesis protein